MIKINDNFCIDRDPNNWILRHTWETVATGGKNKGTVIKKERLRFFGTLRQLCHYTVDLGLEGDHGMEELLKSLGDVHRDLDRMLSTHSREMRALFKEEA